MRWEAEGGGSEPARFCGCPARPASLAPPSSLLFPFSQTSLACAASVVDVDAASPAFSCASAAACAAAAAMMAVAGYGHAAPGGHGGGVAGAEAWGGAGSGGGAAAGRELVVQGSHLQAVVARLQALGVPAGVVDASDADAPKKKGK